MDRCSQTRLESIGVYLPPRTVSTDEVMRDCQHAIGFPLEEMTGIASRRMAGETEFAQDLTRRAIERCLANSRRGPDDIDLLICSHIARFDGPSRVTYEPSCALAMKRHFGLRNAMVLDITNACAGMFSGLYLVDALLKAGVIRCGMVASGEYITHLTKTAQREVRNFLDPRLACLTLGDAGAAVILEPSPNAEVGFHALDSMTLGQYASLCVAGPSDEEHGGAIMFTDSIRATAAVVENTAKHAAYVLRQWPLPVESFRYIIPHQTSRMSIKEGLSEIARVFDRNLEGTLVDNVAQRGNTASTSHWVALMDYIFDRRINAGDRVMFCSSGSGITITTGLYTLDDLPDRLRKPARKTAPPPAAEGPHASRIADPWPAGPRVRIEAVGTLPLTQTPTADRPDSRQMSGAAVEDCLARSTHQRNDVDLLLHAGVYRTDFIVEPALATMVAGELKINDAVEPDSPQRTVCLDVLNGGLGFLNACCLAAGMIRAGGRTKTALVFASEVENNADLPDAACRGLCETASAVTLDSADDGRCGFGAFYFRCFTEHAEALVATTEQEPGRMKLSIERAADLEDRYVACIVAAVDEFLTAEGLDRSRLQVVLPPQISSAFIARLATALGIPAKKLIDVCVPGKDLFTSSTPYAFRHVQESGLATTGDVGLIINVAAGIQVGCALYHF